jgi:DNA repair protein RecN (Recombination protein N)
MLTSLRIQNLALVEELTWNLSPGFTAITGETGSGKSIILGALKLLLGERADKTLLRTGAESCTVEAVFDGEDAARLNAKLEAQGIETGEELILKRTFTASGTNRQFVNCCATTLSVLKSIGDSLVDLHGPHDHQSLLSCDTQLVLLDSFANAEALRTEYLAAFRRLNQLVAEHNELSTSEAALEREVDLLRHQANEIDSADLSAEEEETLLARYTVATNSRRLIELSSRISQRLSEADDSALSALGEVQRLFRELERIDPAAAEMAGSFSNTLAELEEVDRSLQHYSSNLDIDAEQLAQLEERVTLVETLKRKYGKTIPEVIAFGEEVKARLHKIESRGEELERLSQAIEEARKSLREIGGKLGQKRRTAAPKLAKDITAQLRSLGFKKSEFDISLVPSPHPNASGLESVEFLFAPNPGEPPKPLRSIGSSGEISRVMLAVKSSLAAQDEVPLLIFDEIDANVGGEIAHAIGAKMKTLGQEHQVLCITHLPQVAALAQSQFVVTKDYANQRTVSRLTEVNGTTRQEEIARMLGGKTDSALAHAKTLLGGK